MNEPATKEELRLLRADLNRLIRAVEGIQDLIDKHAVVMGQITAVLAKITN